MRPGSGLMVAEEEGKEEEEAVVVNSGGRQYWWSPWGLGMFYVLILVKFTDEKKVVTDGPTDGPTDRLSIDYQSPVGRVYI